MRLQTLKPQETIRKDQQISTLLLMELLTTVQLLKLDQSGKVRNSVMCYSVYMHNCYNHISYRVLYYCAFTMCYCSCHAIYNVYSTSCACSCASSSRPD